MMDRILNAENEEFFHDTVVFTCVMMILISDELFYDV